MGKTSPGIVLPSEASGWKWDGKETGYLSRALFEYINGAAELYLAYGFQNLTVRRFEKAKQPPILLELYEMASSEDAYGVFSFERQDEPVGIGQGSELGGGLLRFWKGNCFVSIYADGEGSEVEPALLELGKATARAMASIGPEPELVGLIPGRDFGLIEKSLVYVKSHVLLNQRFFIAHTNILNLSRKTEAVLAPYLRNRQKTHLLVIRYPDRQAAREAYQGFSKAYLPEAGGRDRLKMEDQKWTLMRQKDEFLLVVFGSLTEADGEGLLRAAVEKLPLSGKERGSK